MRKPISKFALARLVPAALFFVTPWSLTFAADTQPEPKPQPQSEAQAQSQPQAESEAQAQAQPQAKLDPFYTVEGMDSPLVVPQLPVPRVPSAMQRKYPKVSGALRKTGDTSANLAFKIVEDASKFYFAIATTNYWECVRTNDPTVCQNFVESLKDPGMHIGFGLFVVASHGTSGSIQALKTSATLVGKGVGVVPYHASVSPPGSFANYSGMVAGMMTDEMFSSIYHNPLAKELRSVDPRKFKTPEARSQRRSELIAQLYGETVGSNQWWLERVPSGLSMVGAAMLSRYMVPAAVNGAELSAQILQALKAEKAASAVARVGHSFLEYRQLAKLLSMTQMRLYQAARMGVDNPAFGVNARAYLIWGAVEMAAFLVTSHAIAPHATQWWNEKLAGAEFKDAYELFEIRWPQVNQYHVENLAAAWEKFRNSQFEKSRNLKNQYLSEITRLDEELAHTYWTYKWILEGAGKTFDEISPGLSSVLPEKWRPLGQRETAEYRQAFFCGVHPSEAVKPAVALHGMPLPGYGDRTERYQAVKLEKLCMDRGSNAGPIQDRERAEYLKNLSESDRRMFFNWTEAAYKAAQESFAKMKGTITARYERRLKESLLDELKGPYHPRVGPSYWEDEFWAWKKSKLKLRRGVLPSYDQEMAFWATVSKELQHKNPAVTEAIKNVMAKRDASQKLYDYVASDFKRKDLLPAEKPKAPSAEDEGFFEEVKQILEVRTLTEQIIADWATMMNLKSVDKK